MIPAVGTVLKFVGSAFKIPAKAFKAARKNLKDLPAKIQANEEARPSERSSLLSMIGRATDTKSNAKKLWNSLNRGFISKITKPLPSLRFVRAENLIRKPIQDQAKDSLKEQFRKSKPQREKRDRTYIDDIRHQDLKEKWKKERRQRNGELKFEEVYAPNIERQKDIEYRQLQDYYDVLLDQSSTDIDKTKAEFKFEKEKLDQKYEQLEILQSSLLAIQKNFGRLATYNENSFDAVQEQIATSADITDNKQTFYNENLSSDIEHLQITYDNNTEIIADALSEGQKLQAETLDQLNNMEEDTIAREDRLSLALDDIEQQQRERHIQQMYVLNNIGAEIIAAEQQQQAQRTEQAYIYDKFTKKQTKDKNSLIGMLLGGVMGILSSFLNALADPQRLVETMAETAGSFVAEILSAVQFIFGNTVYGLGHLYTWIAKPLQAVLNKFLSEETVKKINEYMPVTQSKLDQQLEVAQWIPNHIGMGMPDMIILGKPKFDGEMAGVFNRGLRNLMKSPLETIASIPGKALDDIRSQDSIWKKFRTFMSYSLPLSAVPILPLMPLAAPAIAARIIATAGIEDKKDEGKEVSVEDNKVKGVLQANDVSLKVKALPQSASNKVPPNNNMDINVLSTQSNKPLASRDKEKNSKEQKDNSELAVLEGGGNYIDNSTTNNIFQTYIKQQEKQFGAGA